MLDNVCHDVLGTAHLSSELEGEGPWTVHGVALGLDTTTGGSGIKKFWTKDALMSGADSLAGKPIVANHINNDVNAVVGQITASRFSEEKNAVVFEGEIDDADLALKISRGRLQVSPFIIHEPIDDMEMNEDGALVVTRIDEFVNLALVPRGAAASNSIVFGESDDLSVAALHEIFGYEPSVPVEEDLSPEDDHEGESGAEETVEELEAVDEAEEDEPESLSVDEVDAVEASATVEQEDEEDEDYGVDWSALATFTSEVTKMEDKEIDPVVEVLMQKAEELDREIDELTLVPRDELAQMQEDLADVTSKLEAKTAEYESLKAEVDTVKSVYAEALSEMTGMDVEVLSEKFSSEELRAMYDEKCEALGDEAEELAPLPDAKAGDVDEQEEEQLEAEETQDFTEEELESIEVLQSRLARYEGRPMWEKAQVRTQAELEEVLAGREVPQ